METYGRGVLRSTRISTLGLTAYVPIYQRPRSVNTTEVASALLSSTILNPKLTGIGTE